MLANEGLVCEPSTDTVEGRDDYESIPLFKWVRCNYKREADGTPYPVAIEGDKNYKETVAKMSKDELENWYDETYQLCLLAFLELDNVERTKKVVELKASFGK